MNTLRSAASSMWQAGNQAVEAVKRRPWTYGSRAVSLLTAAAASHYYGLSSPWTVVAIIQAVSSLAFHAKDVTRAAYGLASRLPVFTTTAATSAIIRTATANEYVVCTEYQPKSCPAEYTFWRDAPIYFLVNLSVAVLEKPAYEAYSKEPAVKREEEKRAQDEMIKSITGSSLWKGISDNRTDIAAVAVVVSAIFNGNSAWTYAALAGLALSTKTISTVAPATTGIIAMLSLLDAIAGLPDKDYCYQHPTKAWGQRFYPMTFCWDELQNTYHAIARWLIAGAIADCTLHAANE